MRKLAPYLKRDAEEVYTPGDGRVNVKATGRDLRAEAKSEDCFLAMAELITILYPPVAFGDIFTLPVLSN